MSRWDVLQKRGDWVAVWGVTTKKISPQLNLYFKTKYGDGVIYTTREIPGGVFIALCHMPEGAVEAAEARKERTRQRRIENINRVNKRNHGDEGPEPLIVANDEDDVDPLDEYDGEYGIEPDD